MTTIAVLGSGKIGGDLARKWAAQGHTITFGARSTDKVELMQLALDIGADRASVGDAVERSDVVVFAIPGGAMAETIAMLGSRLDGKVVIDAANDMRGEQPNSLAAIAAAAPGAAYYRAFNTYGWELVVAPDVGGTQSDVFYCGPDGPSRATVEQLITAIGSRPIRVGDADSVDVVDGVLRLWFALVRQGHGRHIGFRFLED
jgi:predicted dinucleotide-binding enzyme